MAYKVELVADRSVTRLAGAVDLLSAAAGHTVEGHSKKLLLVRATYLQAVATINEIRDAAGERAEELIKRAGEELNGIHRERAILFKERRLRREAMAAQRAAMQALSKRHGGVSANSSSSSARRNAATGS